MKSLGRIYAAGANDERYTPEILVSAILPYLSPNQRVWCPFDTEDSAFVTLLQDHDFDVQFSHIGLGQDFFKYTPARDYDVIVSNPPFSRKLDVFNRLFKIGKPFAMVMNLEILNYQRVGEFFYKSGEQLQLLIPDKKVSYDGNTASFNSSFFCWKLLPRDLMFCHLPHNNSGRAWNKERRELDETESH